MVISSAQAEVGGLEFFKGTHFDMGSTLAGY